MKRLSRCNLFKVFIFTTVVFLIPIIPAIGEDNLKLTISHQPTFESFLTWQAIQDGTDKKHGLELDMLYFDSGMLQVEALPAKQWEIGALGSVPMSMAALRYESYMIGMTHDDAANHIIFAREGNPALKFKGVNREYPGMCGSYETVKGKTILVTTVSSGHYVMSTWLKRIGLKDTDVIVLNMEQGQALAAFESGKGDFVVLWAPSSMAGIGKGWKIISDGEECGATTPLALITSKEYGDKHPENVARFLKMYFAQADRQNKARHKDAKQYQKFLKDWGGIELDIEMCKMDIDLHPMYSLQKNLEVFDASKGKSKVWQWMNGLSNFFTENKRFTEAERSKLMNTPFITDKFLKMAAEMK